MKNPFEQLDFGNFTEKMRKVTQGMNRGDSRPFKINGESRAKISGTLSNIEGKYKTKIDLDDPTILWIFKAE